MISRSPARSSAISPPRLYSSSSSGRDGASDGGKGQVLGTPKDKPHESIEPRLQGEAAVFGAEDASQGEIIRKSCKRERRKKQRQ